MRPVVDSAEWSSLPAALRAEIEAMTGNVTGTSPAGEGLSTSVRLILHTRTGDVFVKGVSPASEDYQRTRHALGADLAPHLTAISPPCLWRVEAEGWDVTGWPALPGCPRADLDPGSQDIPVLTGLLSELSEIPAPGILTTTIRGFWAEYTDEPGLLDGNAIVHRDPNPTNFVVDRYRAWMVDFGWAVRGPAWMTSANFIASLMEAGWDAAAADEALKTVPAWANAPRRAVDELALIWVREWDHVMKRGQPLHKMWQHRATVCRAWAAYRATLPGR